MKMKPLQNMKSWMVLQLEVCATGNPPCLFVLKCHHRKPTTVKKVTLETFCFESLFFIFISLCIINVLFFSLPGESIPIRLFLAGYELTPTFKDVNKKFSVRYFLNLVLVDEEERRYFKQQVCSTINAHNQIIYTQCTLILIKLL
jgi:hypothetical protein